ncbi:MAG: DUF177 domain-containing protein [Firmicutes bacterium]|nr:DUF177 domain-containing protein [Bacillota bacterium]
MKINLSELSYKDKITIDDYFSFTDDYFAGSGIKKLDNIHASGFVYQNDLDEYKCKLNVDGKMMLCDSVTLEEVPYEFNFQIDENINETCINNQNMLDIMELLWENIVLEVPIRYTQSDAKDLKGDNWKVINESSEEKTIDPRMQKLYDYYNKGGETDGSSI